MKRSLLSVSLALILPFLSACDAAKTITQGFKQSKAVSAELKEKTGVEPFVGFNWNNGSLTSVTVAFPEFPAGKSFPEISDLSRQAIKKGFSQEPNQIVISFTVKP